MDKKLRILLVLQTPWGTSLGMSKVHYELKKAYEDMGHQVDYLDATKIYPKGDSLIKRLIGAKITQERILSYLKEHAHKYDVIDANQRCVPYPKESFGFEGKLIFRSHGLPPVYRIAEQHPLYKRMENKSLPKHTNSFKLRIGNFKRYLMQGAGEWAFWDSVKYADIVHVLNQTEYDYLKVYGVSESRLKLIPNGLDNEYVDKGKENIKTISQRTEVSFVGSWTFRKGVDFLPVIIDKLADSASCFNLLGTGGNKEVILSKFNTSLHKINIQTHFKIAELPTLLSKTKVGIFPSYIEGYPLSVVEYLALGIPVVAFDIPGCGDILRPISSSLIVSLGDIDGMIEKVHMLLSMPEDEYQKIAEKCIERAQDLKNKKIAARFIEIYKS